MRTRSFKTSPEDDSNWDKIFQHFSVTGEGDSELFRDLQKKLLLNINSTPPSDNQSEHPETPIHSIEHLNIDDKSGAIQTYLSKREARLELRKERIAEAREKAEIKVETARKIADIKEETANKAQFRKRYIRSGNSKVDFGDSAGVEPDWHEGYR